MKMSTERSAFTLVELLVVVSIVGILVSMLFPGIMQIRESARQSSCANNLRQMALAVQSYKSISGRYPPGCHLDSGASWQAFILSHIDETYSAELLPTDLTDDSFRWTSGDGENACETFYPVFRCPADPVPDFVESFGFNNRVPSSYIAVSSGTIPANESDNTYENLEMTGANQSLVTEMRSGVLTATQNNFVTKVIENNIKDGGSNTLLIGETIFDTSLRLSGTLTLNSDHWCIGSYDIDRRGGTGGGTMANAQDESEVMGSTGVPLNFYHLTKTMPVVTDLQGRQISYSFGSWHSGNRVNFAFADGSTRALTGEIDREVYSRLGIKDDGELVGDF